MNLCSRGVGLLFVYNTEEVWVVVSNIFYFHPFLRKWSNLTNIFQMGWNHQLEVLLDMVGPLDIYSVEILLKQIHIIEGGPLLVQNGVIALINSRK